MTEFMDTGKGEELGFFFAIYHNPLSSIIIFIPSTCKIYSPVPRPSEVSFHHGDRLEIQDLIRFLLIGRLVSEIGSV